MHMSILEHILTSRVFSSLHFHFHSHMGCSTKISFFLLLLSPEHAQPGTEKRKLPDTIDREEVDDLDDDPSTVCYFIIQGNENGLFHLDRHTHILSVNRELDHEVTANYTLIVKATEDCLSFPSFLANSTSATVRPLNVITTNRLRKPKNDIDRFMSSQNIVNGTESTVEEEDERDDESTPESSQLVADDATLVRILVYVQDINDNPPRFTQKTFTGGVTTSANFGFEIMQLSASDEDVGVNSKMFFYQLGKARKTLSEGLDSIKEQPFLIERDTGVVRLNFDPQKGMKGYFDFSVMVKDSTGQNDTARVFIYLLREDQRMKVVLRQQNFEVRERIEKFRR